jgi:hypothetical protein
MQANTFAYDEKLGILTGYYDQNIDAGYLHRTVVNILTHNEERTVESLSGIANRGLELLAKDEVDFASAVSLFTQGLQTISKRGMDGSKGEYIERSTPYLNRIKQSKLELQKVAYVECYLRLISEYIKTNISYRNKTNDSHSDRCDECATELFDDAEYCEGCGSIVRKQLCVSEFVDTIPVPESHAKDDKIKKPYTKFEEMYNRWKGIHGTIFPDTMVADIKAHIKKNEYEINTDEIYWPKNAEFIRKILGELSYTKYIADITLVANKLWNRKLPVTTKKTDAQIEQDWEEFQAVIEENRTKDDKITINYNGLRLHHHLQRVGLECEELEFDITTNKKTRDRFEKLWLLAKRKNNW